MKENKEDDWSEDVDEHEDYHTPPGTFTQNADEIVKTLMDGADGDALKALHRLVFYMNRAGDKLTNVEQLEAAKAKLETLDKENKGK